MTTQLRRQLLITATVTVVLVGSVWLISNRTNRNKPPSVPNLTSPTDESSATESDSAAGQFQADVAESYDPASFGAAARDLSDRLTRYPWSASIPYLTDHFQIFFKGGDPVELEVILESKNGSEFEQYQEEARAWLRQQGAPLEQIQLDISYRGQ